MSLTEKFNREAHIERVKNISLMQDNSTLRSELSAANERVRVREDALRILHDECSVYKVGDKTFVLKFGPMLEPSERAVLRARQALSDKAEPKDETK